MVRIGQTSISDESVAPALTSATSGVYVPHQSCTICSSVGTVYAMKLLNTPGVTHGDIVWINAEAEAAFAHTDTALNIQNKESEFYQWHQRSFVSGAVDAYESAYQVRNLGFSIEPEPIHNHDGSLDNPLALTSNDSAAEAYNLAGDGGDILKAEPVKPYEKDQDKDELDSARFNEYDE